MSINIEEYFRSRSDRNVPKRTRKRLVSEMGISVKRGLGSPWKHTKTGLREDLGIVLRSGWEANICRVLKAWDIAYEFEPMIFQFPIKRGNKAYCPDLYLPATEDWIEVKGYFDDNSRIKLKRFKRFYPDDFAHLVMVIGNSKQSKAICEQLDVPYMLYPEVARLFRDKIPTWEGT